MPRVKRHYSRAFKLSVLERLTKGENVSALAREVGVSRELIYKWEAKFVRGGEDALRDSGRPPRLVETTTNSDDEAVVVQQIALLERRIGRQELELDLVRAALQQVRHTICLKRLRSH